MTKHIHLEFREVDRDGYRAIVDGIKTIETRAATPKYQAVKPGDILVISCGSDTYKVPVKAVSQFDSIKALHDHFDYHLIMPFAQTIDVAVTNYYEYPDYRDKIAQYGLVAFEL